MITVGEAAYNSTITNTTEFLPVTLSWIAAKNCVSDGRIHYIGSLIDFFP